MNKGVVLRHPESFRIPDDIHDPDKYIDSIASAFSDDKESVARFKVIKVLDHEEKVQWLLSLPDHDSNKEIGCAGYIVIITVYICTMVIIGMTALGEPIKEKKCYEKQVEKCVPKKP